MLNIQTIRKKEYDQKWQELTKEFYLKSNEYNQKHNSFLDKLYEEITSGLENIDKIKKIVDLDITESLPDIREKLISEIDKLRIDTSFKVFEYLLVNQEELPIKQKVEDFSIGTNCINLVLMYSGETPYLLETAKIVHFIKKLQESINIWKTISQTINEKLIEEESIWLIHENSLKSIYASLYILEHTYRYISNNKSVKNILKYKSNWESESEIYDSLLADMEEWSQEEWSEEEQQAFTRAMSNLS